MAQSTPLRALANVDAVTFSFPVRAAVGIVVNFYDVAGSLIPPGTGSIDLTAARPVSSYSGPTADPVNLPSIEADPVTPTQTCLSNAEYAITMTGGGTVIKLTPSAIVPPGGGVSYTIKCLAAQTRAPDPLT